MVQILLVEDDAMIREVLAEALGEDGYTVMTHGDGLAALDALSQSRPDLVLLDLRMPHMDGLAFLRWLRSLPQGDAVPVIALTGSTRAEDDKALRQFGVAQVVQKPFDLDNLLALVDQYVRPAESGQSSHPVPRIRDARPDRGVRSLP